MEKRLLIAIVLMIAIAFLATVLFPPRRGPDPTTALDSLPAFTEEARPAEPVMRTPTTPELVPESTRDTTPPVTAQARTVDTVWVESDLYRFAFTTDDGRLVQAWLNDYQSFAPGDSGALQLIRPGSPLLPLALVFGNDTLFLSDVGFTADRRRLVLRERPEEFRLTRTVGALRISLTYRFEPDEYLFSVRGQVDGLPATGAVLLVGLSDGLRTVEADSSEDYQNYAVVTKARRGSESLKFSKVDPGEIKTIGGPFEWVAMKSKYFLAAVLAIREGTNEFGGAITIGGPKPDKVTRSLAVWVTLPLPQAGAFEYDVFVGPQEASRLSAVGHGFEDVNPYGWILRPIIRPIAQAVVFIMVWTHGQFNLSYGVVLILFGLAIRILLWPINQKQMESSARMQAVQPLMEGIKKRYKDDARKMQEETMKLYREHKVNPLGGCLPALIPLPILFALFFVFRSTIVFRGVPFLWLPDLSRADPFYIMPLLMGASMFGLMKIGQVGLPKNPQTKMMAYVMPVFITFVLLRFASGLNLYYAAMNLFSLPQQWLIAKKRLAMKGATPAKT